MMLQENMLQRNRYDQATMISLSVDVDGKYDRPPSMTMGLLFRRKLKIDDEAAAAVVRILH
jgi:hypothetical protein